MTEMERYLLDRIRQGHHTPRDIYAELGMQQRLRARKAMDSLLQKREVEQHADTRYKRFYLAGLGPMDDARDADPPIKVDGYEYGHRQIPPDAQFATGASAWVGVSRDGFTARQAERAKGIGSTREGLRIKGLSLEFW